MGKNAGERAILREEKRLQKEKKRQIEQANKMLIPVSKKTNQSLGIISFDPEGTFRFVNNRWLRVFVATEDTLCQMATMSLKLHGRMRITMHMSGSGGRETCHISLMETGEIYEEVRQKFKHDEEILRTIGGLKQMSVDEVMNTVAENFFIDTRFSYASYVRGNKDWEKECFARVTESDDSFTTGRYYGEGFITLAMPTATKADLIKRLKELGCEFFFGIDMNALSIEEQSDFNRNLEKKYNRRLSGEGAKDYVNTSMLLAIICDSDDARKIVEQTFVSVFEGYGFCMAPAFANQKQVYHSLLSFGIADAKVMRNVDINVLSEVFGGESYENAKVEV